MFNNREIAIIILLSCALVFVLKNKETRKSFKGVIKAFCTKKLVILWISILIYFSILLLLFIQIEQWKYTYLKDMIVWLIITGFVFCVKSISKPNINTFKENIKDNFKLTIIVEFILNIFVFTLIIEILLMVVITIISGLTVIAEKKEKYKNTLKVFNFITAVIGLILVMYTVINIVNNFKNLNIEDLLITFLIPIVMFTAFIPFSYILTVITTYEILFIRCEFKYNKKYSKLKIIKECGISLNKITGYHITN
jgi:hypothetical protein